MAQKLLLAFAAAALLSACSIWATPEEQDAYRAAHPDRVRHASGEAPAAVAPPPAPTPAPAPVAASAPPPQATSAPSVAAANVSVPTPAPPRQTDNGAVVVPGILPRQVPPPAGDPRSTQERMADIRAWDSCVLHLQARSSGDPMRPQLDSPEDICRQRLGMADRTAVPDSRKPH